MEIWIPVVVAVVSAIFSYLAAVGKGRSDLKALKIQHESDLEAVREKHRLDIERLEREQKHELERISSQVTNEAKLYETKAQTDLVAEIFKSMISKGSLDGTLEQLLKASVK